MGTSCNNYLGGTRNRIVILSVPIGAEVHLEWLFYHFPEVLWSSKVKHLMCCLYAIFLLQNNFSLSFINDISRWTYFIPFPKCIHLYVRQEKILLSKGLKHSAPLTLFFLLLFYFIYVRLHCEDGAAFFRTWIWSCYMLETNFHELSLSCCPILSTS